jgi:cytochrome c oxidase subunit 2
MLGTLAVPFAGSQAFAAKAADWQMGMQEAATPIMERITSFHDMMLWIITLITLFVLALLVYVCVKFKEDKNPTPSKRTHNTMIEVVWTAVPVLILVIIAFPSFKLLYFADVMPEREMTVKAIGRQWYWSYEYPDHGNFTFDAYMLGDDELQEGQPRLLATDYPVVIPANTNVVFQVTAGAEDVLHSFAMPAFGIKTDAVPGRLNEFWVNVEEPGTYYGQCSELCGTNHGFMPIMVEVMPKEEFDAWVAGAQEEFASVDGVDDIVQASAEQVR